MNDASDEALVTAARGGDHAAQSSLFARYSPDVARVCRGLAGTALADDCAQDTFLLAMLRLPRLREPAAFAAWLRGIAIYVCRRARAQSEPFAAPAPAALDALADEPFEESTAGALCVGDLASTVRAAVQTLPAGQRDAVAQYYLAGRSYEAAADTLGIPTGALKTRLHKGRTALRHHFRLADGPRPPRIDDRTLSAHEAAHAVLHWSSGGAIRRVAIAPRAGRHLGVCVFADDPVVVGSPRLALLSVLAGEASAARVAPNRPPRDSGDRAQAARIARGSTGGDDVEAALFVANALAAAHERLADPATWTLVNRVAEALVARRTLDADDFRILLTR